MFQPYLPRYRIALFRRLRDALAQSGLTLEIYVSSKDSSSGDASDAIEARLVTDPLARLMGGRLHFRSEVLRVARDPQVAMVIIEQDGCPCCRELHRVNFAKPEITDFIQEHYVVVQLDLYGSRGTVDFDGEEMEERDLVLKWGAQFTPTTIIFAAANTGAKSRAEAEVFRLPGYLRPFHYLTSLEYVVSGEYRNMDFQRFLGVKVKDLQERGIQPEIWE